MEGSTSTGTNPMPIPQIFELALLAQSSDSEPRNYAISWAIIVLSVIVGLMVALRPAKLEAKFKKPVIDD